MREIGLTILLLSPLYIGLFILAAVTVHNSYKYNRDAAERFQLQMAAADAQQKMTNPLTYEACKSIINDVVNFYCVNEDIIKGYYLMTNEELSLAINGIQQEICVMVVSNLSPEVKRQFAKFVNVDDDDGYLTYYVLHTVQILLQDELRRRRQLTNTGHKLVNAAPLPKQENEKRNANGVRTMSTPPQQRPKQ